jgi:23S rRNA pseudouridine1911/1915/1917 synthase
MTSTDKSFKLTINDWTGRLDLCISKELTNLSRSKIQKLIKNKSVKVDGKIVTDRSFQVKGGNEIEVDCYQDESNSNLTKKHIPLDVVYEDDHLLVINKPVGLTVHPGAGNKDNTLVNALLYRYGNKLPGDALRPGIVHRLDKDTSGLMVVAKTDIALQKLSEDLAMREIKRVYQALIYGRLMPAIGTIKTPYGRSKVDAKKMVVKFKSDREAITHYKTIKLLKGNLSLVEFQLETGRTHQIRVHMDYKKTPIVGDQLYGKSRNHNLTDLSEEVKVAIRKFPRQALHAKKLSFTHPITEEVMEFEVEIPEDIAELIKHLV